MADKNIPEINSSESLGIARAFASLIGGIPGSFSSALRLLIIEGEKPGNVLSSAARFQILRLLKGPSLLSPFFYAALTFRDSKIKALGDPTPENLIKVFTPIELASLISIIYIARRCKALCPDHVWAPVSTVVRPAAELGGHVGESIPKIGFAAGLMTGSLPHLAVCMFHLHDEKSYKDYRVHLKMKKLTVDVKWELSTWGCTRFNIASAWLQMLGFGVPFADSFTLGTSRLPNTPILESSEIYRFGICWEWVDSFLNAGVIPDITHRGDFYPTKEQLAILLEYARAIKEKGSKFQFLEKAKEDISPEKTPFLFKKIGGAAKGEAEGDKLVDAEAPIEEVAEVEEELNK